MSRALRLGATRTAPGARRPRPAHRPASAGQLPGRASGSPHSDGRGTLPPSAVDDVGIGGAGTTCTELSESAGKV